MIITNGPGEKSMTLHQVLHPRYTRERLYVAGKKGRGITRIEDSIDTLIQRFKDDMKENKEGLIIPTRKKKHNTQKMHSRIQTQ